MNIDKYPCVVWQKDEFRVVATLKGPVLEHLVRPKGKLADEWSVVDLDANGRVLLKAYHELLQIAQGPTLNVDFKGEPKPAPPPPPAPPNETMTKGPPLFTSRSDK